MEMGRWHRPVLTPVQLRTCGICGGNCVQNEHHWVFDCPALQSVRDGFPRLFGQGCFTQLRKLFGLHADMGGRLAVARDICEYLEAVGGVYSPPVLQSAAEERDAE